MQKDKSTPEEQLLNLIEKDEGAEAMRQKRKRRLLPGLFNYLGRIRLSLPFIEKALQDRLAGLKVSVREPNLKIINKALAAASVILVIYLIADFTFRRPDIKQIYKKPREATRQRIRQVSPEEVRTFLYYLAMMQARNIFSPVQLNTAEVSVSQAKETLSASVQNLRLVGISLGEKPQAMIEDKEAKQTYFLRKGDIINKLKVEAILEDRVILSYGSERMELM